MRHYISVDMEGISGIACWKEMEHDVKRVNELTTAEVNAVIDGILAGDPGAEEILVCDSHAYGENIYPEKLNRKATLIRGIPRKNFMVVGLDGRFDFSYFIGYHSAAGTEAAAMDHTFSGASIREVKINNTVVGEFELGAAYAGHFGVVAALASGDASFCKSVKALDTGTLTVATKIADTRFCSLLYHPEVVRDELKAKAEEAVKLGPKKFKPLTYKKPLTITVNLVNTIKADMAALIPAVKRVSGTVVEYTADNYPDLYNMFEAIIHLSRVQ